MAWTESRELEGKREYRGRYSVKVNGKRTKPSTEWFPYEGQALWAAERAERGEADAGTPEIVKPERGITLGEFGREWLARVSPTVTLATFKSYRSRLQPLLFTGEVKDGRPVETGISRKLINRVTWDDIEAWRLALPGSAGTKNNRVGVLEMIYRDAHRRGLVPNLLPIINHRAFKGKVRKVWRLSELEEAALIEACDPDMRLWVMIAIDAGLRWGEIAGLTVESFAEPGFLEVLAANSAVERKLGPPKGLNHTGADEQPRMIPLSSRLIKALAGRIAEAKLRGGRAALIFTAATRGDPRPVEYATWRARFDHAKLEAFGPDGSRLTGHYLRHTFASRMQSRKLQPGQIQYLMGHDKLETTQGYLHLSHDDHRAMVEAIG